MSFCDCLTEESSCRSSFTKDMFPVGDISTSRLHQIIWDFLECFKDVRQVMDMIITVMVRLTPFLKEIIINAA